MTLDKDGKCKSATLVYLNAGDGPVDAVASAQMLAGESLSDKSIESTAVHASENEINPFGNIHASTDFQRHLAKVLTQKALKQAAQRAGESQ